MDFDLVVRGGLVFDGSGTAPFVGDIGLRDGKIAAIGQITGRGAEEIDASDRIVTPGFIDIHTHYDGQATWDQEMAPSSWHGVTTVVMGNCGVGFAPCRPHQRDMLVKLMEGVEDIPEVVMVDGLPWNWESFPDYLDALDARELDIDIAAQVPHSALRIFVMGEELAPSLYSEADELRALMDGLGDADAGVFQIIPAPANDAESEFALLRALAEHGRRPLSFTLLDVPNQPGAGWRSMLAGLERARRDGLQMRGQVAPRPVGMFFGLDLSLHPFSSHPSYKAIADRPLAERVAAMRDPVFRARLLAETAEDSNPVTLALIDAFRAAHEWSDGPDYEPQRETRIEARAAAAGKSVAEFAYDLLLKDEGRRLFYLPAANYSEGNLNAVREMLGHPDTVMALADGGAHYGRRHRRADRASRRDRRHDRPRSHRRGDEGGPQHHRFQRLAPACSDDPLRSARGREAHASGRRRLCRDDRIGLGHLSRRAADGRAARPARAAGTGCGASRRGRSGDPACRLGSA